jgi:hypothetical protein
LLKRRREKYIFVGREAKNNAKKKSERQTGREVF